MTKTACKAQRTGQVKRRGKASIEWRDEDGTPHYYCYGYINQVCRECRDNVNFAQEDFENQQAQ